MITRRRRLLGCAAAAAVLSAASCGRTPPAPTPVGPSVSFVSPASGLAGVFTSIQIHGRGFEPGAVVTIGGDRVTAEVQSSILIAATAPPHGLGAVDVGVTNPDGKTARRAAAFTYVAAQPVPGSEYRIRIGESVAGVVDWSITCSFEIIPCRTVFLDAIASETAELEIVATKPGASIGLFATEPFRAPDEFPRTLTLAGGQRAYIMGGETPFTLTARRPGTTHSVEWSAGESCTALPPAATRRRYDATIDNGIVTLRTGMFLEGLVCTLGTGLGCNQFRVDHSGEQVQVTMINPDEWHGGSIVERLPEGGWVSLTGVGTGRVEGSTIRAALNAHMWYCPANQSSPFPCHTFRSCVVPNLELTITGR